MTLLKRIWQLLTGHAHHWGVVHERLDDGALIQTCYGCSRERIVRAELRPARLVVNGER